MESQLSFFDDSKFNVAESYRNIRTSILFSNVDKKIQTILITSSKQNEGKSTVIANLAACFSSLENKKVLIIDCDLRNPTIYKKFQISNIHGITDILIGEIWFSYCIKETCIENLYVLTTGRIPPNPSELLSSNKMKELIETFKRKFDYIFIDSPPIGIFTDASILSNIADGTLLVVGYNETEIELARIAKKRLEDSKAKILGVILNKIESKTQDSYRYYKYSEDEN